MAKKTNNLSHKQRKATDQSGPARSEEQKEDQEQQVELEHDQARDMQQEQLGNQGVAAMMGVTIHGPGSAGLGITGDDRDYDLDLDFGGDDDDGAPIDGPQTLRDLTREWNKGTKRGRDTAKFEEPMPAEDLPPLDQALAERVKSDPVHPELPYTDSLDPLLQPSEAVVAGDMGSWLKEAVRWSGSELAHRTLSQVLHPASPALLDPHGRVFHARARTGAIATLLMRDGPVLRHAPTPTVSGFVDVCLELAGQKHTVLEVWWRAQQAQLKLPVGKEVLTAELYGRRGGPGHSVELPHPAHEHVVLVMEDLVDLPPAATLVPFVPELPPEEDDEDDPLGLDALIAEFTGEKPDPMESLYASVLNGAERLASAVARTRVRFAGLGRAICEVGDQWISGAPVHAVVDLVGHADAQSGRILQLLVEIAQAAKKRSVDPQGIRNGLRRAARMLDKLVSTTLKAMAKLVGGIMPAAPQVPDVFVPDPDDPLVGAWADGNPAEALPWLMKAPESLDRDASVLFTRVGAGEPPARLADPLLELAQAAANADRHHLAEATRVIAGSCLLWAQRLDEAFVLGQHHVALGRERRNGLLMASGALLAMEVHHANAEFADRDALQYTVAKDAWHMGQRAAFTLMLRWHPADSRDDYVEAFFS